MIKININKEKTENKEGNYLFKKIFIWNKKLFI